MKSRINLHGLRASAGKGAKSVAQALRRMIALSLLLLLLPAEILAQQAYPYNAHILNTRRQHMGSRAIRSPNRMERSPTTRNSNNHTDNKPLTSSSPMHHNRCTPATAKARCAGLWAAAATPGPTPQCPATGAVSGPIALYPDPLVAQVLTASTYPAQVADADRWRQAQGYAPAEQIAGGADAQNWDPSVKALTAFPQVLAEMDRNMRWTTDLGNAYYNQPQDILQACK